MKEPSLYKVLKQRAGLTLIEVIVAMAISGLLGGGVITAIYQIGNVNNINNARVTAVKQVENSIHYLNRDVQMAQKVEVNGQGYWLKLSWTTWDNDQNIQVKYIYDAVQKTLSRSYSVDNGAAIVSLIGKFVTAVQATAPNAGAIPAQKAWTFQMTCNTNSGLKQAAETRQITIIPRPGS